MKHRVILEADNVNLIFALKAALWLLDQPATQKDAILTYGSRATAIYVKRNKASISSRQIETQP